MSSYVVFLRKELQENLRTKRFFVLMCVFLFFAFSSPLLARYARELTGWLVSEEQGLDLILGLIPPPTWVDSYSQFYSNLSQTGAITVVLIFMSIVLREKRGGTVDLVFCKGLCRTSFIMAKFTVAAIVIFISLLAAVLICYVYTLILFEYAGSLGNVFLGALAYGVFLWLTLSLVILGSTIAKSTAISAVIGFFGFLLVVLLNSLPRIGRMMPGNLMSRNVELTIGTYYDEFAANLVIAVIAIVVFLALSINILKRQEL
ncbi:MAG: ABC transporter permease [Oscillospiraceae bacterium]|nr:ABC transporter permease [Oscillospiraceae bacterium]